MNFKIWPKEKKRLGALPKKSFVSNNDINKRNPDCNKIGDLATSIVRETNHPDYYSKKFYGGYIFFVISRYYSMDDTESLQELVVVDYSTVEDCQTLIKSENKKSPQASDDQK